MEVKITKPGPPITEQDIRAFEADMGCRLPQDYRDFLQKYNGGVPEPYEFRDVEMDSINWVVVLYSLLDLYEYNDDWPQLISEGFLAMARDIAGEPICIFVGDEHCGKIYGISGAAHPDPDGIVPRLLGESFTSFLDGLSKIRVEKPDPLLEFSKVATKADLEDRIRSGFDVNERNERGRTLVMLAAAFDNRELVEACLGKGASMAGALHHALRHYKWELAKFLIDVGADINEVDHTGKRPIELVFGIFGKEREEFIAYLRSRGAK